MNNNEIEKLAVVIGGVHHNTLGVIRGLGEKGVKTGHLQKRVDSIAQ